MENLNQPVIYTTPYYQASFDLDSLGLQVIALPLQKMGTAFMKDGKENDICIMPYVSGYQKLLTTFRSYRSKGPVIFISNAPINSAIMNELPKYGAIAIDLRQDWSGFIKFFLMFLIEHQQIMSSQSGQNMSEIVNNINSAYQGDKTTPKPPPSSVNIKNEFIFEEKVQALEKLRLEDLIKSERLLKSEFSLNFEIMSFRENRNLPLYCTARLVKTETIDEISRKYVMFFNEFYPDFIFDILVRTIRQPQRAQDQNKALVTVQFIVKLDDVNRSCIAVPKVVGPGELGFVPLTDFFLQKRRYFRIVPSIDNPLTAIISSDDFTTRDVPIIDVSERGLSFWYPTLIPMKSMLNVYIHTKDLDIICKAITRFTEKTSEKDKCKIGIELFPHEKECILLRKYVFDCQIKIFKALKEELWTL